VSFVRVCQARVSGELLDGEKDGEPEEGEAGELPGALAQSLVQTRAEAETELGKQECLHADQDDGEPEREMQEADREANRELVKADRDPECEQDKTVAACELADLLPLVFFLVQEHPGPEQGEHGDCDVVGGPANEMAECVAEEQANDRHRHLEARHHEADAEARSRREPAHAERGRDGEGVEAERQDEEEQLQHGRGGYSDDTVVITLEFGAATRASLVDQPVERDEERREPPRRGLHPPPPQRAPAQPGLGVLDPAVGERATHVDDPGLAVGVVLRARTAPTVEARAYTSLGDRSAISLLAERARCFAEQPAQLRDLHLFGLMQLQVFLDELGER
jgi:hypothetical protein